MFVPLREGFFMTFFDFSFFQYRHIIIIAKATRDCVLPEFKGSMLRGAFGHTFKKIACSMKQIKNCKVCPLNKVCSYYYCFETPVPDDSVYLQELSFAPHPFLFKLNDLGKTHYQKDDTFQFELIIIGKRNEYFPYFVHCTITMLEKIGLTKNKYTFAVQAIYAKENLRKKTLIYNKGDEKIIATPAVSYKKKRSPKKSDHLSIKTITPWRIKHEGHLSRNIDFYIIIKNILRRASLLSYFHHDGIMLDFDFKNIVEQAKNIQTVSSKIHDKQIIRYSSRQETKMRFDGIEGEFQFDGNIQPFLPLIQFGELIHIGKNTAFGFGEYKMYV